MPEMTRQERIALRKKQEKISVKSGNDKNFRHGEIAVRFTDKGLAQYIKYKGQDYVNYLKLDTDLPSIEKLTDSTGGTASNTIANTAGSDPTTAEFENAIASLTEKVNDILNVLKANRLIKKR